MSEVSCVLSLQTVHMTDVSLFCNILWGNFCGLKFLKWKRKRLKVTG